MLEIYFCCATVCLCLLIDKLLVYSWHAQMASSDTALIRYFVLHRICYWSLCCSIVLYCFIVLLQVCEVTIYYARTKIDIFADRNGTNLSRI